MSARSFWPMYRIKHIHFIGIGGSGMNGIAEVLHNLGYEISGSDVNESATTKKLVGNGIKVSVGHSAELVADADAVVVSTAIPQSNPELREARRLGLPVVPRATMLNELLRLRQGIAVAGSHGKTTITSMIASTLHEGGLDPTYVVGGLVRKFGTNAGLGKGKFIVVESDESDGSFLHLSPVIAVASNIDSDHLAAYGQDLRTLKRAFIDFFENLPFYGVAILCHDDPQLLDVSSMISKRSISYGIKNPEVDFHACDIRIGKESTTYSLKAPYGDRQVRLKAIGEHNVVNSLAAFAVAHEVDVTPEDVMVSLENFAGVGRRLESHGEIALNGSQVLLLDDYAHHPTEIEATLSALRSAYPHRRIVLVFQPHRYSRTRDLFDGLTEALASADLTIITEVYSAGEDPIPEASGQALQHALHLRGVISAIFVADLREIPNRLTTVVHNDDLVVTMGAGSINSLPRLLAEHRGE